MTGILSFYLASTGTTLLLFIPVALLLILPGLVPAVALAQRMKAPVAAIWPVAASITLALLSIVTTIVHYAGSSLTVAAAVLGLAALAAGALSWGSAEWKLVRPERAAHILAACVALLGALQGAWLAFSTDSFYHLAAARSLLTSNAPVVTDPFFGMGSQAPVDPTSGSWHIVMALVSAVLRTDVTNVWAPIGAVASGLLVLAFWSVARELTGSERVATIASLVYLAGAYLTDFRGMAFPSFAARVFLFVAIFAVLRLNAEKWRPAALVAVAGGVAAASVHLGSAQVLFVLYAVLLVGTLVAAWALRKSGRREPLRVFARLFGVVVAVSALQLPALLPRLKVIMSYALTPQTFEMGLRYVVLPLGFALPRPFWLMGRTGFSNYIALLALGYGVVNLLVIAAVVRQALRANSVSAWMGAALVATPLAIQLPPMSSWLIGHQPYMLARLGEFAGFAPYLGIALLLTVPRSRKLERALLLVTLAMFAVLSVPGVVSAYWAKVPGRPGAGPALSVMWNGNRKFIWRDALPEVTALDGERIASDPVTGYQLSGLAGTRAVAVPKEHSPFFVEAVDGDTRREDLARLMTVSATAEERESIMRRYDADYLAVSDETTDSAGVIAALEGSADVFERAIEAEALAIFRLR